MKMAKYQKVENCGPVPYPDRSGRFLVAGETAEGDDWEPLVALGYIVKLAEAAAAPAKAALPKEAPKAAILQEDPQGVSDVVSTNDGAAAEAMDPSKAGESSDEGVSGRAATRRRR
jgi:hypothetical protein